MRFLLVEDKNTVPQSVTAIPVGLGISEIVLNLNLSPTWQKEVDRPTRLLQFVASVHLPFSFRSLDLLVASLLFRKGTSFCVTRGK